MQKKLFRMKQEESTISFVGLESSKFSIKSMYNSMAIEVKKSRAQ
jgi:hypothetical protein